MSRYPRTDAEMAAFWNDQGQFWADTQARLDDRLRPYGQALFRVAKPLPGEHGLDIGCGCGDTTIELGRAVAPGGDAVGLDVSEPMIARARARAAKESGGLRVSFIVGDATRAPLPASQFDLAISRFGIMFFEDPAKAFGNIRSAIKPGGRLVFICWRKLDDNPWMKNLAGAVAAFAPPAPTPDPEAPGPFSFADPDRVRRVLSAAGFEDAALERFDSPMHMGADVDSAVTEYSEHGTVGALLGALNQEQRAKAIEAFQSTFRAHATADGIRMGSSAWIVSARAS